ncbi:MAG: aminopeptidase N [Cardiobacteriaceae bacterium]|nr:aminopeptidase N [Cardiobacteriaceae bacterium]
MSVQTTKLADYRKATFATKHHELHFAVFDHETIVTHSQTIINQQAKVDENGWQLTVEKNAILHGEHLDLLEIYLDDKALSPEAYTYTDHKLTLFNVPEQFTLKTVVRHHPETNTELSGLYRSNGIYCTQCEAEGFRRISFAFDRPDVLSTFRVRIESDKALPVQLSNGNLEEQGELPNNRHYSIWFDPHLKPTYLFALVVGDLEQVSTRFTTPSGKKVDCRIYTEKAYIDQTEFAMKSLTDSIAWDEKRFGLSYDLDRFNLVAISDFNMGAMENKGLNIFNTRYVLANSDTATDADFHGVQKVIGHEYFHNWTGNRITCRDWFQLSLKEGLTVFRDQEFSSDLGERTLERIADVRLLRTMQFPEDNGPMSHPVQPQEYAAIDNFYTLTVYEKGAEIIRMYHTILGEAGFQQGMKEYVKRFDGQAVRIEDFAAAMSASGQYDFTGDFFKWYTTAGTPRVRFNTSYNQHERTLTLTAAQDIDAVNPPNALVIPISTSFIDPRGRAYRFSDGSTVQTLILDKPRKSWTFDNADENLIPVLMQGFSAPVYYEYHYERSELATLIEHCDDGFARYEALQSCYRQLFENALKKPNALREDLTYLTEIMEKILQDSTLSSGEKALLLEFPSLDNLISFLPKPLDMDNILKTYDRIERMLALKLQTSWQQFLSTSPKPSTPRYSVTDAGIRQLRGLAKRYLSKFNEENLRNDFLQVYQQAQCMTERNNALLALNQIHDDARHQALEDFAKRFAHLPLVMDKWFALQATDQAEGALERIKALCFDERFTIENPNRFRAVIQSFTQRNMPLFHAKDGSGYRFVTEQIQRIITRNPQLAARMLNAFAPVSHMDHVRRDEVKACLQSLAHIEGISVDVRENIDRLMAGLT